MSVPDRIVEKPPLPRARPLEAALLFTIAAHAAAMVGMALLLLPGMPGGVHAAVADRATFVAAHPWRWRIGWLGWQTTALSDLLLAVALLLTPWIARLPAWLVLIVTVLGLIPDQTSQWLWTWPGVALAQRAVVLGSYGQYAGFESHVFRNIAGWGTVGYLSAALGWTWCFAAAGTWSRGLTWLSIVTWGLFAASTVLIFLPPALHPPSWMQIITSAGNAVAFVLLMLWLLGVTRAVFLRSRPGGVARNMPSRAGQAAADPREPL